MGAPAIERAVHDLHAPLTVIRGLCAGLEACERRAELRRTLALIDAEVLRLARGLRELASGADPAPARTDLAVVVRDAARRFAAVGAPHGITVRALAPRGPAEVAAPADRVERILDNLLRNAVRHAGPGGTVTVRAGVEGAWAVVRVRDGGRGVRAEDRERIFLPGVRGAGAIGAGNGLGLAIAREVAHELGGALTLDGPGPGASFRLRLPLGSPPCAPVAA